MSSVVNRGYDLGELVQAMEPYYNELVGFDPSEWLKDERNIALTDGLGSFSWFEYRPVNDSYQPDDSGADTRELAVLSR